MRVVARSALAWFAAACSGGKGSHTDIDGGLDGPAFVIDSPLDGATVGGTLWFSVSPFNAGDIESIAFRAGDEDLGTDTDPSDGFRVFLDAKSLPGGSLTLAATATGRNGGTTPQTITVTNVPAPPETATVGPSGAVLGTRESNGARSTLMIPPGAAQGATVTFTARTKAEVKAATGVDYDALGVTFLGAQDLVSSVPIGAPVAVSSGGFGPMVQPGHIAVQYAIQPDANGDGIGELVVVNTASVAPNGDVISDPVPRETAGPMAGAARVSGLLPAPPMPNGGPPGTRITFDVTGFNTNSANGTCAEWVCSDGSSATVCGAAQLKMGRQVFETHIPACPPGPATVSLRNLSTQRSIGPFSVIVTLGTPIANPLGAIGGALDSLGDDDTLPDTGDPEVDGNRSDVRNRSSDAAAGVRQLPLENPAVQDALEDAAEIFDEAGLLPPPPLTGECLTEEDVANLMAFGDALAITLVIFANAEVDGALDLVVSELEGVLVAIAGVLATSPRCEPEPKAPCSPSPTGGGGTTGMGSLPAAIGGLGCGNVGPPPSPPRSQARRLAAETPTRLEPGRFLIRIVSNGTGIQFSGTTDAGGYFFIPAIPAGQPFTAIALDKVTGQTRQVQGVGPSFPDSVYLYFDFWDDGEEAGLAFNSNTPGVLEALEVFTFSGTAGEVVTAAALVDQPPRPNNLNEQTLRLFDPDGIFVNSLGCYHGTAGPGYDYAASCPLRLAKTGRYSIELTSTIFDPQAFTLGLALTEDPTPVTLSSPSSTVAGTIGAVGDWQYHRFSGAEDDLYKLVVDQAASTLDVRVIVRRFDPAREFFDPGSGTVVAASTSPSQRAMATQRFALPETGDYIIEVMANWPSGVRLSKDGFLGPYALTFLHPATQTISLDTNAPSSLALPGFDVFAFQGTSGQPVNVALTNPDRMNMLFTIEGPDGTTVEAATAGGFLVETDIFRLPDTGTYRLIVDPLSGASGAYTLGLPVLEPPVMLAGTASGELLIVGERRFYRFSGNQGEVRNVILSHPSGTLNATVRVLLDNGTEFWNGTGLRGATTSATMRTAQTGNFTLPQTGAYILEVRPTGFDTNVVGVFEVTVAGP